MSNRNSKKAKEPAWRWPDIPYITNQDTALNIHSSLSCYQCSGCFTHIPNLTVTEIPACLQEPPWFLPLETGQHSAAVPIRMASHTNPLSGFRVWVRIWHRHLYGWRAFWHQCYSSQGKWEKWVFCIFNFYIEVGVFLPAKHTHEAGHSINTEKCFRCQPAKKYGNIQYAL